MATQTHKRITEIIDTLTEQLAVTSDGMWEWDGDEYHIEYERHNERYTIVVDGHCPLNDSFATLADAQAQLRSEGFTPATQLGYKTLGYRYLALGIAWASLPNYPPGVLPTRSITWHVS